MRWFLRWAVILFIRLRVRLRYLRIFRVNANSVSFTRVYYLFIITHIIIIVLLESLAVTERLNFRFDRV